jgi:hypothetical protein
MKFSGVKENGKVELELFFRSDDKKVLSFFQEFSYYKKLLEDKLILKPYYKYSKYVNEEFSNDLSEKVPSPCVKETKMCATSNYQFNIKNPRIILLENIRQSCVYKEYGLEKYWNYMSRFGEFCLDLNNPDFNGECANKVLNMTILDYETINNCMKNMIEREGKIEEDYMTFQKRKIYSVPDLYINGIPYRGTWLAQYIFNSICNGFLDDEVCASENPSSILFNKKINIMLILILSIIIFCVLVLSLLYYKKFINSDLERVINSKIEEYTLKSISQYKAFPSENNSSSKLELE